MQPANYGTGCVPNTFGFGRLLFSSALVEVSELNNGANNDHAWLSEDGLTIDWDRSTSAEGVIWTAHRERPALPFGDTKMLCNGKCPTVSSDGLEMILVGY